MNEPPSDWYVATLLDAAANRLEALADPDDVEARNLVARLRHTSLELQVLTQW